MNRELEVLTGSWEKRPGASREVIGERERSLGFKFPTDYVDFMVVTNGAIGGKEEIGIEIDPIEEMAPDDKPLPYLNGIFRLGGDGAEEIFAFDARSDRVRIVMVRDSISEEDILWQGDSFTEFVRNVPLYDPPPGK
jgi:hypothetical protein